MKNKNEIIDNNLNQVNDNNNNKKEEEEENNNEQSLDLTPITKLLIKKNFKEILKSNPDDNIIIIQPKNNENRNVFINDKNNGYQKNMNNNFNSNKISNNNFNKYDLINKTNEEEENNTRVVLKAFGPKSNNNTITNTRLISLSY